MIGGEDGEDFCKAICEGATTCFELGLHVKTEGKHWAHYQCEVAWLNTFAGAFLLDLETLLCLESPKMKSKNHVTLTRRVDYPELQGFEVLYRFMF